MSKEGQEPKFDIKMINEKDRLATFKGWPFKKGSCTKEKMAQAGFYRINNNPGDDSVECFVCFTPLDGWEQCDEPFKEHLDHSSECIFAQGQQVQDEFTLREWINILRQRNDNINKQRLQSMTEKLEAKINKLDELFH